MQDDEYSSRFGFRPVLAGQRQGLVNQVFARVADRYDTMNDLMSGGLHRLWKDELINWLAPPHHASPFTLLDVAGGTGDIARRFLRAAGEGARCVICDISLEMLESGRKRHGHGETDRLDLLQGNAELLPVRDAGVDAYTIAFGIRNVTDIDRAIGEAYRVLKPGGRFLCLEFSEVHMPGLDRLYERYSFSAIPTLGALVTGNAQPYQYLVESIRQFPDQETFAAMIRQAGFEQVKYRNLSGGIAALHSGWRI